MKNLGWQNISYVFLDFLKKKMMTFSGWRVVVLNKLVTFWLGGMFYIGFTH